MCTLEASALTKKSSIMVCDSFRVNMLLISPDKRWIAAGTTDHGDFSPKVFRVCSSVRLLCSFVFLFVTSLSQRKTLGTKGVSRREQLKTMAFTVVVPLRLFAGDLHGELNISS